MLTPWRAIAQFKALYWLDEIAMGPPIPYSDDLTNQCGGITSAVTLADDFTRTDGTARVFAGDSFIFAVLAHRFMHGQATVAFNIKLGACMEDYYKRPQEDLVLKHATWLARIPIDNMPEPHYVGLTAAGACVGTYSSF